MKKLISSKFAFIESLFWSVIFFILSVLALLSEVFGLVEEKGAGILWFAIFTGLLALFLWYLNRAACVIYLEDGMIKRKGLIGGFCKECSLDSIREVVTRLSWREGKFIYLVDNSAHQFDRTRKDSYICFRKTRKNMEFLRTFWKGDLS